MRGRVVAGVLGAALGAAALGAGALVVAAPAQALPGTSVAGQDVSGLDEAGVRRAVEELASAREQRALPVTADDVRGEVDRVVEVDVDATVDAALASGRTGLGRVLGPLLGAAGGQTGRPVGLVVSVDRQALDAEVSALKEQVDRAADPGGIDVRGTTVTAKPPRAGRVLEPTAVAPLLERALQEGRSDPLDLPVAGQPSPTTPADVELVVAQARRALGGPYSLAEGEDVLTVSPSEVGPLLRAPLQGDRLVLKVDLPGLSALVEQKAEALELPAREAGFVVAGTPPVVDDKDDMAWSPQPAQVAVTPGATGVAVDVDPATARLAELVVAADRTTRRALPLEVVEPDLTTAEAQGAGVRTLLGTFTTYFQAGQPRATNIRRIAEIVDGAYLAPDEVFSLNGTAGRRTTARGFVSDGAIVDGELTDEVGGGVSQFATTLFNAAFFAGLPIPEHKPHSFFLSRYPAGRESTVYFGSIDVKVRNDTGHGIHVETSSTEGSVTVALYGDNGGRLVTASHGPRQPREGGGFRIAVTRRVSGGDGVGGTRVFRTSYAPEPDKQ